MTIPAISIILPVYNVAEFLSKCFESIRVQTFVDYEVVVVNDGSTDDSGKICDGWASKDSRIKVIHSQNQGVAAARNLGIEQSRGSYIYFMDPDDWIEPDLLSDNHQIAVANDFDIVIFGFFKEQQINGKPVTIKMPPPTLTMSNPTEIVDKLVLLLQKTNGFSVWTKLIKKELLTTNNLVFPPMKRGQDMSFSLDLYRYAQSIYVNEKCYYHYNAFTSANKFDTAIFESHLFLYNKLFSLFGNWMEIKPNFMYAIKLFIVWFGYVVPANIVGTSRLSKKEKLAQLQNMVTNPEIQNYIKRFKQTKGLSVQSKASLYILGTANPQLNYIVAATAREINRRSKFNFKKVFQ